MRWKPKQELIRQERALTYDCMLQTEGTTTAIREETPMLGSGGGRRQHQLQQQGRQVDEMMAEFSVLNKDHEDLDNLKEKSGYAMTTGLTGVGERVFDLANQRDMLHSEIDGYRQGITDLRNQDDSGVQQRISDLVNEQKQAQDQQKKLMDKPADHPYQPD